MAVPLEKFVKQLEESRILAAETLHDFIPPQATPKDAEELARELIRQRRLTKFQAEQVWLGKGKSLVLGNYVVLEKIGQGGMGQVYKAQHRIMERIVALKVLSPTLVKDPSALQRFQREMMATARITHPNIVTAFDADQEAGTHFLVMEYVDGDDLAELVKKNGPLSVAKAVNYTLQAARGLEAAHAHGIVHRDIKPANLLLDNKGTVKILDMGLAKFDVGDAQEQAGLTATGAIMGTVDFMAPEQALSTRNASASADIYSLGCSLFYLLTGKATYGGESLMSKLMAHREQPVPSIRASRPDVPEHIEAIFRRMVAKRVEDRYRSMTEVIADLERAPAVSELSVNLPQPSLAPASEPGLSLDLEFLRAPPPVSVHAAPAAKSAVRAPDAGRKKSRVLPVGIVVGVLILALGVFLWRKLNEGTLVVEVDQLDVVVEVFNERKKVEFHRRIDKGPLVISVGPGKHRVTVEKAGFNFVAKSFEMNAGGKKTITVELQRFEDPVAARNAKRNWFQPWAKQVEVLPAEKQFEAVVVKLQELNPGFEGTPGHQIENGIVTGLQFGSDMVADLAPIKVLSKLRTLTLYGASPQNKLASLAPLRGMELQELRLGWSQVTDLSPLKGMPLNAFETHSFQLSDLSPLAALPLTRLECFSPLVSDLASLAELKLVYLKMSGTQVSDLSPLKGMPLTLLHCHGNRIVDLSPIRELPLQELSCDFVPQRDAGILRSIKTLEVINGKPAVDFWKEVDGP